MLAGFGQAVLILWYFVQGLQEACTVITKSGEPFRSERESRDEGKPDQKTSETPLPLTSGWSKIATTPPSTEFGPGNSLAGLCQEPGTLRLETPSLSGKGADNSIVVF